MQILTSFLLDIPAPEQRPHFCQQEELHLPVEGLLPRGEAVQGTVHAGRAHAEAHWGEAAQMHGESKRFIVYCYQALNH